MGRAAWDKCDLGNPGVINEKAAQNWLRYGKPVVELAFRPRLEGLERLPDAPYMLVGNHSGMGNAEITALTIRLLENRDRTGPLAAMVHPISFNGWPQGPLMRRLGAIPSTYEAAQYAVTNGVSILVFPGGDYEATRPIWQANQVQFAGRQGFLKIAQKFGLSIVPLGIRGSHYTAPVLWRSERILPWLLVVPRMMGMKRYALTLLGLLGVATLIALSPYLGWWLTLLMSWVWLVAPIATLPWIPWSIRMEIGQPISASELFDGGSLESAGIRVEHAVQVLVRPL